MKLVLVPSTKIGAPKGEALTYPLFARADSILPSGESL